MRTMRLNDYCKYDGGTLVLETYLDGAIAEYDGEDGATACIEGAINTLSLISYDEKYFHTYREAFNKAKEELKKEGI